MKPRHRISRAAIGTIERFEGYRRKAAQLPDGRWTLGYGHTLAAREGAEVSEDDAEVLLRYDLIAVSHAINEWVHAPLNQNQFDALCSFAFNIGVENFRSSGVLKRLNEGAFIQAACAMELWRKAEFGGEQIVVDALVRRRASEKALFLTPVGPWPPAPTPILRPSLDIDVDGMVPRDAPVAVTTPLHGEQVRVLLDDVPPLLPTHPDKEQSNLVQTAAEAVTARLQSIFPPETEAPPSGSEPDPESGAEGVEAADPDSHQERVESAPASDEPGSADAADRTEPEAATERMATGDDAGHEAESAQDAEHPFEEWEAVEDAQPFGLRPGLTHAVRDRRRDGLGSVVALGAIGLVFFGGGVIWALDVPESAAEAAISPILIGWLAGIAGVGLFSVAVYLLLQRLARTLDER